MKRIFKREPSRNVPVAIEPPPVSEKADLLYHYARCNTMPLRQEESDAITMKMIRKFQELGIPIKPMLERLRHLPITATNETANVVALSQYICPLPGVSIELKARFQRDSHRTMPLSFHFIEGPCRPPRFPHASQHTGWGLSDVCMTAMPHRPDLLPLWSALHKRRVTHANSLTYRDQLLLLQKKREECAANSDRFLELHLRLWCAIAPEAQPSIERFIDRVSTLPNIYDYLSETNQAVVEAFIKKPYQQAVQARCEQALLPGDHKTVAAFLEKKTNEVEQDLVERISKAGSDLERTTLDFILKTGIVLKKGIIPIIIQEMSEPLNYPSPPLDAFSRKLQAAAFKQATAFVEGRCSADELESDLILFTNEGIGEWAPYADELEAYYASRRSARA